MSGRRPSKRLLPRSKAIEDAISYEEFSRYVRQFKTQRLLRMLADIGRLQWLHSGKLTDLKDPISPHCASLVALEAMGGWGATESARSYR